MRIKVYIHPSQLRLPLPQVVEKYIRERFIERPPVATATRLAGIRSLSIGKDIVQDRSSGFLYTHADTEFVQITPLLNEITHAKVTSVLPEGLYVTLYNTVGGFIPAALLPPGRSPRTVGSHLPVQIVHVRGATVVCSARVAGLLDP